MPSPKYRTFTHDQKIEALRREIRLRKWVYPKRVRAGKISQAEAAYEIGVMQAILDDYERQVEEAQLGLEFE